MVLPLSYSYHFLKSNFSSLLIDGTGDPAVAASNLAKRKAPIHCADRDNSTIQPISRQPSCTYCTTHLLVEDGLLGRVVLRVCRIRAELLQCLLIYLIRCDLIGGRRSNKTTAFVDRRQTMTMMSMRTIPTPLQQQVNMHSHTPCTPTPLRV